MVFPGNVRELRNIIERSVIMERNDELTVDVMPTSLNRVIQPGMLSQENITLEEMEKRHIKRIIEQVNYNKSAASRLLGIARKTLREKMEKYHIQKWDLT